MIQVAADRSRGEAQQVSEFGSADGPVLQNGAEDAVPGALVCVRCRTGSGMGALRSGPWCRVPGKRRSCSVAHGIHNTIMS